MFDRFLANERQESGFCRAYPNPGFSLVSTEGKPVWTACSQWTPAYAYGPSCLSVLGPAYRDRVLSHTGGSNMFFNLFDKWETGNRFCFRTSSVRNLTIPSERPIPMERVSSYPAPGLAFIKNHYFGMTCFQCFEVSDQWQCDTKPFSVRPTQNPSLLLVSRDEGRTSNECPRPKEMLLWNLLFYPTRAQIHEETFHWTWPFNQDLQLSDKWDCSATPVSVWLTPNPSLSTVGTDGRPKDLPQHLE